MFDPEDMPEELKKMLMKKMMESMGAPSDLELVLGDVSPLPPRVVHPLYSRVVLTPAAKESYRFPREPEYGVVVYNSPVRQWATNESNPSAPVNHWDCVVALKRERILLFLFDGTQLRAPREELIDIDPELDAYRLPERRSFAVGDEVCIDESNNMDKYAFPKYPAKGLVVDLLPEGVFLGKSEGSAQDPVDCVIRCKTSKGSEDCYMIPSSCLRLYSAAEEEGSAE